MKNNKWQLKADGTIEKVGPFGSYGPTLSAANKSEATAKFLAFAFRAAEHTPEVKIRNGAYQLAYESLEYGVNVEAGIEGSSCKCCSGEKDWRDITDKTASFDYYASDEYQKARLAA